MIQLTRSAAGDRQLIRLATTLFKYSAKMGLIEKSTLACAAVLTQLTATVVQAKEFCTREKYWCETGHCCGNGQCCNYYYELWWFWVIWIIVLLIGGCCAWQRRRVRKLMRQQNRQAEEIQTVIQNSPPLTEDWFFNGVPPWKLPSYADIGNTVTFGTPPPPYAQLNEDADSTTTSQQTATADRQQHLQQQRVQQQSQQQPQRQRGENVIPQILAAVTVHRHCEEIGIQTSEAQIRTAMLQNNRETSSSQIINVRSSSNTPDLSPTEVKIPLYDSPTSNEPSPIGAMASLATEDTQVATEATETAGCTEAESPAEENNNRPRFRDTVVELCGGNQTKAARV